MNKSTMEEFLKSHLEFEVWHGQQKTETPHVALYKFKAEEAFVKAALPILKKKIAEYPGMQIIMAKFPETINGTTTLIERYAVEVDYAVLNANPAVPSINARWILFFFIYCSLGIYLVI